MKRKNFKFILVKLLIIYLLDLKLWIGPNPHMSHQINIFLFHIFIINSQNIFINHSQKNDYVYYY